ncbi:MAG: putative Zn finger protein [Alteromonadaceae bacterium]|jgi:uncharacterized Zn finger protein
MPDNKITTQQAQLTSWFSQKSVAELTEIVMSYVNASDNETSKWQLAMLNEQSGASGLSVANIKNLIIKALPVKEVFEWHKVGAYFDHSDEMFAAIFIAIDKLPVDKQWQLVLHALIRLNKVLEQIDDSGGFRFTIEGQLNQRLSALFTVQTWPNDEKAQWIFEHYKTCKYDVFPAVPEDFTLSDKVNRLFLSLCDSEVKQYLQSGGNISDFNGKWALQRLIMPLITQAEHTGDWREQSRLMEITANKADDFIKISQHCIDNNDQLNAERWLKKSYLQATTSHEKKSCQQYEVTLRTALKEYKKAWQLAWQLFTDNPSFNDYKKLETLQHTIGVIDPNFVEKSAQLLAHCYAENSYGGITRNADALLDFYLYHQELNKARLWALSHKAELNTLRNLADLIVATHPQDAVDLYYRVIMVIIERKKNSAYQEATDLLLHLSKIVNSADKALVTVMIGNLIKHHKAKRNMMKLLKEYFALCF